MRPIVAAAARSLRPATKSFASAVARPPPRASVLNHVPRRPFSVSAPRKVRYERFDFPPSGQPGGNNVTNFLRRRLGGDRGMVLFGIGIGGGLIYYVAHLERVPDSGRVRFMDCSPAQEEEMGKATFVETVQQYGNELLPTNHPVTQRVRQIAQRLIEANGLGHIKSGETLSAVEGVVGPWGTGDDSDSGNDDVYGPKSSKGNNNTTNNEWEVFVVNDPSIKNAFVIPGGKIFVFTGILPVSANDDGLATVMGHEIAHVVARHGAERMSSMKVLFAISFLLESLGLDVGLTRLLVTFLLQLPNSRTNESEADYIGLHLMARACYDPSEAPKMWERMSAEGGGGSMDFMSTHPANSKRIKALAKEQPEADDIRNQNCSYVNQNKDGFMDAYNRVKGSGSGGTSRVWA